MTLYIIAIGIVLLAFIGAGIKMRTTNAPTEDERALGCIVSSILNAVVLWALIDALVRSAQ